MKGVGVGRQATGRRCWGWVYKDKKISKCEPYSILSEKNSFQIFRNKFYRSRLFLGTFPIIQMLILCTAVTFEIRNIQAVLIMTGICLPHQRSLISKLEGSTFFKITYSTSSEEEANALLLRTNAPSCFRFLLDFGEKETGTGQSLAGLLVSVNAINASTAQLSWAYLEWCHPGFQFRNCDAHMPDNIAVAAFPLISIENRYWYSELLNYKYYMLSGNSGILVTAIGFLLAG